MWTRMLNLPCFVRFTILRSTPDDSEDPEAPKDPEDRDVPEVYHAMSPTESIHVASIALSPPQNLTI